MSLLAVVLLAIALSIDALGIGTSYSLRGIKVPCSARLIICFISVLVTALAVSIGSVITMIIPKGSAKLIGAFMMIILGIFIIYQSIFKKEKKKKVKDKKDTIANIGLAPLGVTIKIIRNPVSCDFDKSSHIDKLEAVYLGFALSIDSLGAGISSAVSGLNSFIVPIAVGVFQLLFLCIGSFLGKTLSKHCKINSKYFVMISGGLLIFIGVLKLFI